MGKRSFITGKLGNMPFNMKMTKIMVYTKQVS